MIYTELTGYDPIVETGRMSSWILWCVRHFFRRPKGRNRSAKQNRKSWVGLLTKSQVCLCSQQLANSLHQWVTFYLKTSLLVYTAAHFFPILVFIN